MVRFAVLLVVSKFGSRILDDRRSEPYLESGEEKRMKQTKSIDNVSAGTTNKPAYISHYGIRAQQYREMIEWYQKVFRAKIQHENEFLAFMTFDEEHHGS